MGRSWSAGGTILIRVGPHHFAFLRGYFEGLPLHVLSKRYLETAVSPDPDLRIAKSTLKWIRDQLMMAARRRGMFAEARLILLDPDKLRIPEKRAAPSLEEFREIRDPLEMFSEAELIDLFHEEYGSNAHSDRRTARNDRLRRRQVAALLELEKLLVSLPLASDDVAGWLHPALAKRLKDAEICTLEHLVDAINERGYRWWTRVPRFGEKAAAQVIAWLQSESATRGLGMRLGLQALSKVRNIPEKVLVNERQKQFGIVPMEHLLIPSHLDGSVNCHRACKIAVRNDLEAIQAWLATKHEGSSTWRSYRKEAERILLWAVLERDKSLSALTTDDCREYWRFLEELNSDNPETWPYRRPRSDWLAPRGTKRWSTLWRPFEGGLSAESRRQTTTILSVMGRWFVNQGYWDAAPWQQVELADSEGPQNRARTQQGFTEAEWLAMWRHLNSIANPDEKSARIRFILALCKEAPLRLSELVRLRREHLQLANEAVISEGGIIGIQDRGPTTVQFSISGKVLLELDAYLALQGMGGIRACALNTPLIFSHPRLGQHTANLKGITTNGLYFILKKFFSEVARACQTAQHTGLSNEDVFETTAFKAASARWLRT